MSQGIKVYLALGSNLGDRLDNIDSAIKLLGEKIIDLEVSKVYETEPWGVIDQPQFLNACCGGSTYLKPKELLKFVKDIENRLGRKKRFKWGPREIDIDILFYGDEVINDPELTIPHPYLDQRDFVLVPLNDIATDFVNPVTNNSVSIMNDNLDSSELTVFIKI